jgi:hypothetical protein
VAHTLEQYFAEIAVSAGNTSPFLGSSHYEANPTATYLRPEDFSIKELVADTGLQVPEFTLRAGELG